MIDLIVLFAAGYITVFALLALAFFAGSALVRRVRRIARLDVTTEAPKDDVNPDGGAEDRRVAV